MATSPSLPPAHPKLILALGYFGPIKQPNPDNRLEKKILKWDTLGTLSFHALCVCNNPLIVFSFYLQKWCALGFLRLRGRV
jgi:hypothetical protein